MPSTGTSSSSSRANTSGDASSRFQADGFERLGTGGFDFPGLGAGDGIVLVGVMRRGGVQDQGGRGWGVRRRRGRGLFVQAGTFGGRGGLRFGILVGGVLRIPASRRPAGAKCSRLWIGRRIARRMPYSTAMAQASARATRQETSSSMSRAIGLVAITTAQPYSSGRLCTVSSASTASIAEMRREVGRRQQHLRPKAVRRERDADPLDLVRVRSGAAPYPVRAPAGASGRRPAWPRLMIAFNVAANAARLAGSFSTSSAVRAWSAEIAGSAGRRVRGLLRRRRRRHTQRARRTAG